MCAAQGSCSVAGLQQLTELLPRPASPSTWDPSSEGVCACWLLSACIKGVGRLGALGGTARRCPCSNAAAEQSLAAALQQQRRLWLRPAALYVSVAVDGMASSKQGRTGATAEGALLVGACQGDSGVALGLFGMCSIAAGKEALDTSGVMLSVSLSVHCSTAAQPGSTDRGWGPVSLEAGGVGPQQPPARAYAVG